ncbi:D-2-hydroxyacid dehydrogenase [Staphylococcus felis]|uniref:D-2-hydroxyacid dehydrogenase n=1 Tax=Staphylococcus felis TaxID=46127 RepID=UPI000E23ECF6|nr:D-2-hydroxyacid dehydrogenase [Staphylococcus felis]REI08196.1 D-2-hydroxyacid dehydrogenase [Staphylococcus felis]
MKKIKIFDVREDEHQALENWMSAHQGEVEVELTSDSLGEAYFDTLDQIDGISTSQTTTINNNYLKILAEHGIYHVAQRSAGYDMFDLDVANQLGIKVSNVPSYSPQSIAEFAVMRILELVRHTYQIDQNVSQQCFDWSMNIQGRTVESLKIGVIGTGRIGSRVAKILNGFGSQVYGYDLKPNSELESILTYVDSVETLVQNCDVLTIHIPGSKDNHYFINQHVFQHAKEGLLFVNTARGSVVDTQALIEALDSGVVSAAALDTYENEGDYFRKDWSNKHIADQTLQGLLGRDNVLISPHVAFYTDEAVQNLVDIPLDDVLSYIHGKEVKNIVNP